MTGQITSPPVFDDPAIVYAVTSPLILEASAGSGKTTVLVERWVACYLYLLLGGHRPPSGQYYTPSEAAGRIVAITFTRKAAAEMKERIRERLVGSFNREYLLHVAGMLRQYVPGFTASDVSSRIEEILRHPEDIFNSLSFAPVSTIHAYGLSLLHTHPVETQVDPSASPSDEEGKSSLSVSERDALFATFRRLINNDYPPFRFAVRCLGSGELFRQLRKLFQAVEDNGWELFESAARDSGYLEHEALFYELPDKPEEYIRRQVDARLVPLLRNMLTVVEKIKEIHSRSHKATDELAARVAELLEWAEQGKNHWVFQSGLSYDYTGTKNEELNGLRNELSGLVNRYYLEGHKILFPAVFDVLRECYQAYEKLKEDRGEITFNDIELKLTRALADSPELRAKIRRSLDFILIDEYQDTSATQKKLFDLLVFDSGETPSPAEQFTSAHLRTAPQTGIASATLPVTPLVPFIVGDPKQSIYLFRGADVRVFLQTRQEFVRRFGENAVKFLDTNYRSVENVVDGVNRIFGGVIPGSGEGLDLDYQPQKGKKPNLNPHDGLSFLSFEDAGNVRDLVESGAGRVSQFIRHLIAGEGYRAGEIMILVRAKTHIERINRILAREMPGTDFVNIDHTNLLEVREIRWLLSYLRSLDNPDNDYYFSALLKSPFFRFSDGQLLELVRLREDNPLFQSHSLYRVLGENRKPEELAVFDSVLAKKNKLTIPDLAEEVVRSTGYAAFLHTLDTPERKLASSNLVSFLENLRRIQQVKMFNLTDFLYFLDNYGMYLQQAKTVGERSDVVRVMTIHSAKGLEARAVFLFAASADNSRRESFLFDRGGEGIALGLKWLGEDAHYSLLKERLNRKESEEEKRLAYVALTRARERFYYLGAGYARDKWKSFLEPYYETFAGTKYPEMSAGEIAGQAGENNEKESRTAVERQLRFLLEHGGTKPVSLYPEFITVTQLLDIEFSEPGFRNRYIVKSYPLVESLSEMEEEPEELTLSERHRADKGSLLHEVFQYAGDGYYRELLETKLALEYAHLAPARAELLNAAESFFRGDFYSRTVRPAGFSRSEWDFHYACAWEDRAVIIKGTVDKYLRSDGEGVIVDYKLHVGRGNQARYERQLNYYGYILSELGYPVDRLYLYDIEEEKAIEVKYAGFLLGETLRENVDKIIRQFR